MQTDTRRPHTVSSHHSRSEWPVSVVFRINHKKENRRENTRLLLFAPASTTDKDRITGALISRKQLKPIYLIDSFYCGRL